MKNSESSFGGYIVLAMLVALLAAPIAIGHVMMKADAKSTLHADASAAQ